MWPAAGHPAMSSVCKWVWYQSRAPWFKYKTLHFSLSLSYLEGWSKLGNANANYSDCTRRRRVPESWSESPQVDTFARHWLIPASNYGNNLMFLPCDSGGTNQLWTATYLWLCLLSFFWNRIACCFSSAKIHFHAFYITKEY